jgi:colicin import membrane protein
MHQQREPSASESYFWPSVWAIALHVLVFGMLFVSFAMTPDLPPAKPIVQATLYQLKSKSQATTQTNQKIAGEAQKSAARQTEVEQMEQKKVEQEAVKAAAEQKKEEAAQKAEESKRLTKPRRPTRRKRLMKPRKPRKLPKLKRLKRNNWLI